MKKMSLFRLLLTNFAICCLFLIIGMIFLELATRLLYPIKHGRGYDVQRVPKPHVGFAAIPNTYDHNSQGYRGRLLENTAAIDIVFLGGSSVYNGNPTIPRLVEIELGKLYPKEKFKTYNLGIPSSKSSEELSRLVHEAIQFKPEMIVSYHGANDLGLFGGDPRAGYPFDFYLIERNPLNTFSKVSPNIFEMLIINSSFARHFFAKFIHKEILGLNDLRETHLKDRKARALLAASILKSNIRKLKLISTSTNSRFISILQPLKAQTSNQYNGLWHGIPFLRKKIANKEELNNYSMLDFLSEQQSCFVDEVHITSACKRKVAPVIAARIARELNL